MHLGLREQDIYALSMLCINLYEKDVYVGGV